jgi:protein-S-isoprenylcysteine O-methyltransferase Ste14
METKPLKKILPPTLFWICLTGMVLLRWAWPAIVLFRAPFTYLGSLPICAGCAVMLAAWSQFQRAGTNINTFSRPGRLVTDGLFRFSRNPMYLGMAIMLAGVWLLLGALSPGIGVLLFIAIAERVYIIYEEKAMQGGFGDAYAAYRRKTRRWI